MSALRGWLAAAHPVPLALVLLLTALIGVASADGEPNMTKLVVLLAAMALSQLAIGWSNDYLDRETDAQQQPWKPIPAGLVNPKTMPPAIGSVLAGSLVFGALLGWTPLVLVIAGTACGLAYNLGLKDTALSPLPFVVALGLLPAYVWTALDVYQGDFLWLYLVGAPLALAAHLSNTLPDIELDRAVGRQGLAVRLGLDVSVMCLAFCLAAPVPLSFGLGVVLDDPYTPEQFYDWSLLYLVLLAYGCLAVVSWGSAILYGITKRRSALVWGFRCVALAGIVLATGWLAAVT